MPLSIEISLIHNRVASTEADNDFVEHLRNMMRECVEFHSATLNEEAVILAESPHLDFVTFPFPSVQGWHLRENVNEIKGEAHGRCGHCHVGSWAQVPSVISAAGILIHRTREGLIERLAITFGMATTTIQLVLHIDRSAILQTIKRLVDDPINDSVNLQVALADCNEAMSQQQKEGEKRFFHNLQRYYKKRKLKQLR